ncbi:MAG: ATP-binding protein, partial [Candidatus Nanopelagicaceae bacterium]
SAMRVNVPLIVVHNTFSTRAEIEPYIRLAEQNDYMVISLMVENLHGGESVHGVPPEKVQLFKEQLKERFQP